MKTVLALLPSSHAASQSIHCWKLAEHGQVSQETWSATELAVHKGTQCVVVVPGSCLSWLRITLPPHVKLQGNARSMQLLQGLVEEQLLEDADAMHLALPPHPEPGPGAIVAACGKAWLAQWLQALEHAGVKVLRVIPECAPDVLDHTLWCVGQGYDAWVSGLQEATPVTVPVEAGPAVFTGEQPVKALPSAYAQARQAFGEDRVQLLPEHDWLQMQLQTRWNLAQFGLAGTWVERWRRKSALWGQRFFHASEWRAARLACVVFGIGLAVILNVQAWRQKLAVQAQQEALVQTVQQTFPHLKVIVDAPLQMQRELQRLRRDAGVLHAADFEPMAAAAGGALHALGQQASGVQYTRGQILLEGIPAAQLEALNQRLADSGYVAVMDGQSIRIQEGR